MAGIGGLTGFETTPAGVVAVAKTADDSRVIIRRDTEGVWGVVHEFAITGGAIPPTFIAHGPSGVIVLQSGDHQAAHFDQHHRLSVSLSNADHAWRTEAPVGIPHKTVIEDAVGNAAGYVVVGWVREGDAFTSRIWTSPDGLAWTEQERWPHRDINLNHLAEHDGQFVIVGFANNKPTTWVSSDLDTWEQHKVKASFRARFASIGWVDEQWMMVGSPLKRENHLDGPVVMASPDGAVWSEVVATDRPQPEFEAIDTSSAADLVMIGVDKRRTWDRNLCLLEGCPDPVSLLYSTVDGTEWQQRSTPYSAGSWKIARVEEALLLVRSGVGGLEVWAETDQVAVTGMLAVPPTEDVYPWLDSGTDPDLELGVEYAMRVGGHCGLIHLAYWHGVDWVVDPDWEFPSHVDGYNDRFYGIIELIAQDRITFRVDDEVYAEYVPREERFLCG